MKEEDYFEEGNRIIDFLGGFVMDESSTTRKVWELLLLIMLLYIAIIFPYSLAFQHFRLRSDPNEPCEAYEEPKYMEIWEWIVFGFFWVDLFVNFFLTYRTKDHKKTEIKDIRKIAVNYLRFFFWVNLIACMPSEVFQPALETLPMDPGACTDEDAGSRGDSSGGAGPNAVGRMMRLQRATRLARLARLIRIVKIAHVGHGFKTFAASFNMLRGFRIFNLLVFLLWVNHMMACGWYLVAAMHTDHQLTWVESRGLLHESHFVQWIHAMYFILTVFTTVGFGDMSAHTVGEILYVAVVMVVGAVVHSMVIGEVINIVQDVDKDTKWKDEQTNLLDSFGDHTSLPDDTKSSLREFVEKLETRGGSYDRDQMHSFLTGFAMPRKLLGELPQQLFNGLLLKNKLVMTCARSCPGGEVPPRFPLLLSTHLNAQMFRPEDVVYQIHDHAFNIYMVLDGIFVYMGEVEEGAMRRCVTPKSIANTRPMARSSTFTSLKPLRVRPTITLNPPESQRLYSSERGKTSSMLEQNQSAWTPKVGVGVAIEGNDLGPDMYCQESMQRASPPQHYSSKDSNSTLQSTYGAPWLQVDLGVVKKVKGIVMQGHPKEDQWVKKYKVQYCAEEEREKGEDNNKKTAAGELRWKDIDDVFAGCADRNTESQVEFPEVPARFVRILPIDWHNKISARVGVIAVAPLIYTYRVFNKMDFFGEEMLMGAGDAGATRHATARCDTAGEVLLLHKRDLLQNGGGASLLTEFPEFQRALRVECLRRYASRSRMLKWFSNKTERCKFATAVGFLPDWSHPSRWAANSPPGELPDTPPPELRRGDRAGGAANYAAYVLQVAWRRHYSPKRLHSVGAPPPKMEKAQDVEFKVVLDKTTGRKLGAISEVTGVNGNGLQIREVTGGLVQQWNQDHPELAVKRGDRIAEVNGMEKWWTQNKKLELVVQRRDQDLLHGDTVKVLAEFQSSSQPGVTLREGCEGDVLRIDEDGDAQIRFNNVDKPQWVLHTYYSKLRVVTKDQREEKSAASSADFESRVLSLVEGLAAEVKEVKTKLALLTDGGRLRV